MLIRDDYHMAFLLTKTTIKCQYDCHQLQTNHMILHYHSVSELLLFTQYTKCTYPPFSTAIAYQLNRFHMHRMH